MKAASYRIAVIAVVLGGCTGASDTKLATVTQKFSDVVAASSTALKVEVDAKPRIRRGEALELFLKHPEAPTNFTADNTTNAFARYVCAGTNALRKEKSFLDFANAYSQGAAGIVKPGGDTFAEQWKRYQELRKPVELPKAEDKSNATDAYDDCGNALLKPGGPLSFDGVAVTDKTDEFAPAAIPAAIAAYQALFTALENAAKDGLKAVNEVEARSKFKTYVAQMHEGFRRAMSDLPSGRLVDAWSRRKAYALWAPYQTFSRIIDIRRNQKGDLTPAQLYEIKELVTKLQTEMNEYDTLNAGTPPDKALTALSEAESAVYQAATDDSVSLDALTEFLGELVTEVNLMNSDYNAVEKAVGGVQTQTAALGQ